MKQGSGHRVRITEGRDMQGKLNGTFLVALLFGDDAALTTVTKEELDFTDDRVTRAFSRIVTELIEHYDGRWRA